MTLCAHTRNLRNKDNKFLICPDTYLSLFFIFILLSAWHDGEKAWPHPKKRLTIIEEKVNHYGQKG